MRRTKEASPTNPGKVNAALTNPRSPSSLRWYRGTFFSSFSLSLSLSLSLSVLRFARASLRASSGSGRVGGLRVACASFWATHTRCVVASLRCGGRNLTAHTWCVVASVKFKRKFLRNLTTQRRTEYALLDFERKSPTAQRRREYALLDFDVRNPRGPERKRVAPRPASNRHSHHLVAPRNCECHIVPPLTAEPNAKKRETARRRRRLVVSRVLLIFLNLSRPVSHNTKSPEARQADFAIFAVFLHLCRLVCRIMRGDPKSTKEKTENHENERKRDTEANREKGRNARNYRAVNHHVDCTFSVLSAH